MIEGVDFSSARPGGAALRAAGKLFVARYVPYDGAGKKGLTAAEIVDYRKNGLEIVLVFESIAARALAGFSAGYSDAKTAKAAIARLGMPSTLPVYFAVDFDASLAQQAAINFYLQGAADVIGTSRVGVYGGYNVIARCRADGSARWFWQTYAWSHGRLASFAHLYQYSNGHQINGGAVDFDRALKADYGQWGLLPPDTSTPEDPMTEIDIVAEPRLVDLPVGIRILNPDGSGRIEHNPVFRTAYSPGTTMSAGGTLMRLIVWTRPAPDPDLLLAAYDGAVQNVRSPDAAAVKAAVNAAVDHIKAAADKLGVAIGEARIR